MTPLDNFGAAGLIGVSANKQASMIKRPSPNPTVMMVAAKPAEPEENMVMSEEDGTADCTHMIFGARWSPEFSVKAPHDAGLERESYPSLGHNSWPEAAFSNAPQSGNVSAATTTLRWSYSYAGHMTWPEIAFPNALTFENDTRPRSASSYKRLVVTQIAGLARRSYPCLGHILWHEVAFSRAPPLATPRETYSTLRWSYPCFGHSWWPEAAFSNTLTSGIAQRLCCSQQQSKRCDAATSLLM